MSDIYIFIIIINVKYSFSSIQHSIGRSSQRNWRSKKKKKNIKDIQIRKEDVKWFLFTDDIILYVETLNIPQKS